MKLRITFKEDGIHPTTVESHDFKQISMLPDDDGDITFKVYEVCECERQCGEYGNNCYGDECGCCTDECPDDCTHDDCDCMVSSECVDEDYVMNHIEERYAHHVLNDYGRSYIPGSWLMRVDYLD